MSSPQEALVGWPPRKSEHSWGYHPCTHVYGMAAPGSSSDGSTVETLPTAVPGKDVDVKKRQVGKDLVPAGAHAGRRDRVIRDTPLSPALFFPAYLSITTGVVMDRGDKRW